MIKKERFENVEIFGSSGNKKADNCGYFNYTGKNAIYYYVEHNMVQIVEDGKVKRTFVGFGFELYNSLSKKK